jgi:hypothetical protein
LRIENSSAKRKKFFVGKRETDSTLVHEILVGSKPVAWKFSDGRLAFEIKLNPGESATVRVKFHRLADSGTSAVGLRYRLKTVLRRHLSELRDNYVTKIKLAVRPPPARKN